MDDMVIAFGQASSGKRYFLGVFESTKCPELKRVYRKFVDDIGGEVALISSELNKSGLFEI